MGESGGNLVLFYKFGKVIPMVLVAFMPIFAFI